MKKRVLCLLCALAVLAATGAFAASAEGVMPGDLNQDGSVTDDDAIYLLMYTFFADDYPIADPAACDFDGDGTITADDAIYLLMYTFFPDDYPLVETETTYFDVDAAFKASGKKMTDDVSSCFPANAEGYLINGGTAAKPARLPHGPDGGAARRGQLCGGARTQFPRTPATFPDSARTPLLGQTPCRIALPGGVFPVGPARILVRTSCNCTDGGVRFCPRLAFRSLARDRLLADTFPPGKDRPHRDAAFPFRDCPAPACGAVHVPGVPCGAGHSGGDVARLGWHCCRVGARLPAPLFGDVALRSKAHLQKNFQNIGFLQNNFVDWG